MRITNNMMMNSFMTNLNYNMNVMSKYQNQLSSNKRINKLSDDPIGIMSTLDAKAKLRKLDMHGNTIGDAQSWLKQTETSLREMNEMLVKAYENTVTASNGSMSADDKEATAEIVEQIRQHLVQLGNSTYGGRFIFGGYNTTSEPFTYDASGNLLYNGTNLVTATTTEASALQAQTIQYSTGINVITTVSVNGVDIMGTGENNLNKILSDLVSALRSDAGSSTISSFINKLQNKQQDTLSLLADVGGRINRLDMMEASNADNEINYTEILSKVEDIDQAEVTMQFKMAEAIYRSALAVGARVISPTLLDFMS